MDVIFAKFGFHIRASCIVLTTTLTLFQYFNKTLSENTVFVGVVMVLF